MAINFPNAPAVGDVFTPPGLFAYKWDGEKWTATAMTPSFPPGTTMLFYNASAPVGWTKLTTQDDKALRVVSGAGGVAGGTNKFSTVMAQSVVGNTTLSAAMQTNMSVSVSGSVSVYPSGNSGYNVPISAPTISYLRANDTVASYYLPHCGTTAAWLYTNVMSGANSMAGATTGGTGTAHNHPITMAIQYIDIILASKD